mgnify:CR=1 FL=1|jgi:hypothetical protein
MPAAKSARVGDAFAIGLSGLCLIHCLALPIAAGLLPLAGAWAAAHWVHWAFALTAMPISLWALTRRRAVTPLLLGLAGLGLLFAGAAEFPSPLSETVSTVAGGLILSLAHVLNWRSHGH